MKVIEKEELNDKKYQEALDGLTPELAEVVKTTAAESGIREDVFLKLKGMGNCMKNSILLYDFLKEHFYGPEWYELFEKILKEKENGESYLEILRDISSRKKLSAADVEHIYQNTDSEYGFQKVLEEQQSKDKTIQKTWDKRGLKEEKLSEEQKKEELEVPASADGNLYENFYQEVTKPEPEALVKEEMDQHDRLVAAVINSNNEYKDMKNRLKDMEKVARMQNDMIIQYKNNVDSIQKENKRLKKEYEQLQNENEKLKKEYGLAMYRLTEINNFTAGNSGNKLFP